MKMCHIYCHMTFVSPRQLVLYGLFGQAKSSLESLDKDGLADKLGSNVVAMGGIHELERQAAALELLESSAHVSWAWV